MMCMRFESKHQEIKSYTNVSFNRKNICMSVGRKFAFKFSDFLLNNKSVSSLFENFKRWSEYPDQQLLDTVQLLHSGEITPGRKLNYKGTDYSIGDYILPTSGAIIIKNFLKTSDEKFLIVYKKVDSYQRVYIL